jgi:RNA polymerase sigma-70 factor (ECF subfamily)
MGEGEDLTEAESLGRLNRELRRMPKRCRVIFLAVRLDGASYAELAEQTGLSIRQVEREIAAALLQLDDALCGQQSLPWWSRLLRVITGGRSG